MKTYLFTSESVSEGHPDKVSDQISDSILDEFLRRDPESKVACETFCTTGTVMVMGEVKSETYVDIQTVVRDTVRRIGYNKSEYMFEASSCGVLSAIHEQSADINQGVEREDPELQGAGDQGIMFGYACRETDEYMPLPLYLSHRILEVLGEIRHAGVEMPYLRPDAKSQFTVEYDAGTHRPVRVHTIVLSTQHDDFDPDEKKMHDRIENDVRNILIPRLKAVLPAKTAALIGSDVKLLVNPTGKFVLGGPHADTGLTGRKIIVDTYGGRGAHGGGAFSGKDPSKVDRSAAKFSSSCPMQSVSRIPSAYSSIHTEQQPKDLMTSPLRRRFPSCFPFARHQSSNTSDSRIRSMLRPLHMVTSDANLMSLR